MKSHLYYVMDENNSHGAYALTALIFNKDKFINLVQDISDWYINFIKNNNSYKTALDIGWLNFHFTDIKKMTLEDGIPLSNFT